MKHMGYGTLLFLISTTDVLKGTERPRDFSVELYSICKDLQWQQHHAKSGIPGNASGITSFTVNFRYISMNGINLHLFMGIWNTL